MNPIVEAYDKAVAASEAAFKRADAASDEYDRKYRRFGCLIGFIYARPAWRRYLRAHEEAHLASNHFYVCSEAYREWLARATPEEVSARVAMLDLRWADPSARKLH